AKSPSRTPALQVARWLLTLPEDQQFSNPGRQVVAVSPDGTKIVYVADRRLYLRPTADLQAQSIPGSENGRAVTNPVFSPDGQRLGFLSDKCLQKIAVRGGAAVTLWQADNPYGMSWDQSGIVFGQGDKGVLRVPDTGGMPTVLARVMDGEFAHGPQVLPGGQ